MSFDLDTIIGKLLSGSINNEELAFLQKEMQGNEVFANKVKEIQSIDQIEKYLANKLNPKEQAAFEKKMQESKEWREKVESYKATKIILAVDQQERYSKVIDRVIAQHPIHPPKTNWWKWLISAFIGLVCLIAALNCPKKKVLPASTGESTPEQSIQSTSTNSAQEDSPTTIDTNTSNTIKSPPPETNKTKDSKTTPPASDQPVFDLDSLAKALNPVAQLEYLDKIRLRDSPKLNAANVFEWERPFIQGDYDRAKEILVQFFQKPNRTAERFYTQAYYLSLIYLYKDASNAEQQTALEYLESIIAPLKDDVIMVEPGKDVNLHLLRAYLLVGGSENEKKARNLISENPSLLSLLAQ